MGKRKLTDKQIITIANSYATESDATNFSFLSSRFNVSTSTISDALHYAISYCLVNERIAKLIAEKAIRHDNVKKEQLGYPKSGKVTALYNNLLVLHRERKVKLIELSELKNQHEDLKNHIETYDELLSSSDEYPYSKEQLEAELAVIDDRIKEIESTLK